ncbi:cytochrome P450 [Kitasatospora sp. GAS1066B]|uniref:cytochrome P450 n=1 Tax=Kitasatospora sp. GAS1066B TaxID=3156271 RepID=UPI003515BBF0
MVEVTTSTAHSGGRAFPEARTCPFQPPKGFANRADDAPLQRVTLYNGTSAWLVTGHAEARQLLTDSRLSANSRADGYPFVAPRMEGMKAQPPSFIGMDPPAHTVHRRMLIPDFSVKRMRAMRPGIERVVEECIDRMLAMRQPVDLVTEFALPVPAIVISDLLGVPYEDHAFFEEHSLQMVQATTPEGSKAAGAKLAGYLNELISKQQESSGENEGVIGRLAVEQVGSGALAHHELVQMAMLLLVAGHQTTASMISLSVAALLEHPEQLAILRADPTKLPGAVDELLRLLAITDVAAMRVVTADIEIAGQTIRAGEGVVVSSTLVNRDEKVFPDPDSLDIQRDARPHMAFSHGVHQCLGQNLARLEIEVALEALFRRIPTLRLAEPFASLPVRGAGDVQGVHTLPVAW